MTDRKFTHPDDLPEGTDWIGKEGIWQTEKGFPVRLYATDGGTARSHLHGAYCYKGNWWSQIFYDDGEAIDEAFSIVDVPRTVRVQGYINVHQGGSVFLHPTRPEANHAAAGGSTRVACIKIDMEVEGGRFDD